MCVFRVADNILTKECNANVKAEHLVSSLNHFRQFHLHSLLLDVFKFYIGFFSVFSVFSIVSFPNEECISNLDSTNGEYEK